MQWLPMPALWPSPRCSSPVSVAAAARSMWWAVRLLALWARARAAARLSQSWPLLPQLPLLPWPPDVMNLAWLLAPAGSMEMVPTGQIPDPDPSLHRPPKNPVETHLPIGTGCHLLPQAAVASPWSLLLPLLLSAPSVSSASVRSARRSLHRHPRKGPATHFPESSLPYAVAQMPAGAMPVPIALLFAVR